MSQELLSQLALNYSTDSSKCYQKLRSRLLNLSSGVMVSFVLPEYVQGGVVAAAEHFLSAAMGIIISKTAISF